MSTELKEPLKCIRYTTADGHVWIARQGECIVGAATKDAAKAKLNSPMPYTRAMPEKYTPLAGKAPLIIVGSNSFLKARLPFYVVQNFDVHLFLCPTADRVWRIGAALFSRLDLDAAPLYVSVENASIETALSELLYACVSEATRVADDAPKVNPKLVLWHTHWVYRCHKIALKEVQALETYEVIK